MFLELTLYSTDKKILININKISAIFSQEWNNKTIIQVDETTYAVKESYEAIEKGIYLLDQLVNR